MKRSKLVGVLLLLVMTLSLGLTACKSAAQQGLDDEIGSYQETKESLPNGSIG